MDIKKAITTPFYREFTISTAAMSEDSRSIELAFSSEAPYERYYGIEILDHSTGAINLERLNDGAPLLLQHNPDKQIGVVESVNISDGIGRAVVRFGKGGLAEEVYQDVKDGIRRKVSVGYMVNKMVLESQVDDVETYRVTDWTPLEVSIVSIPADNSVGVGREIELKKSENNPDNKKENKMDDDKKDIASDKKATAVDVKAIEDGANVKAMARLNELLAIGDSYKDFGGVELARKHIAEGKSASELTAAILERAGKASTPSGEIGLSTKEVQNYSFLRALNALANPGDKAAQNAAAYEREVSDAAAKVTGKAAQGLIVPFDVLNAPSKRDLVAGTGSAGGHTVATNLLSGSFIEMLRKRMVTAQLGATTLTGLVGNIALPRQASGATAYWVAESGAPTESQQAFDQVTMSPKTVGAFTDYSRKLLLQSSIDVENFVRGDLIKQIGLEVDRVSFYGSGSSNEPQGIKGTSGINTVNFAAMAPTYAEIVALETQVAADNADIGTLAYALNARGRGSLKTTEKASSTAQFIWETGNTVNGYRAEVSNQIDGDGSTTEDYFFGNWADLLIGFWSGLDLIVDPYSNSTSGTVRVVALQDVDIAVRHAESFCRGANTL